MDEDGFPTLDEMKHWEIGQCYPCDHLKIYRIYNSTGRDVLILARDVKEAVDLAEGIDHIRNRKVARYRDVSVEYGSAIDPRGRAIKRALAGGFRGVVHDLVDHSVEVAGRAYSPNSVSSA